MKTAMRLAFENVQVNKNLQVVNKPLVDMVINQMEKHAGEKPNTRGWKANLHPATVKSLTSQGVFG